ncbi:polysaccharide pyruvyl transferase [hydrocarbon metagenome]|uniref:Polysaccharide pyruvyl transferase n=1 Tax=hydrocarbon metagenome TaxID=938273 RepID=A0A0W8E8P9_9ZZZZ
MKIALSGYYGFDNAGDEALLAAICHTIKNIEPRADFVVFSGSPEKTAHLHSLRAVNRMNPWIIFRELLNCDLLISGGGSLLQDVTGPRSLPYYISIVALAKLLRKPVIFYAQGIGPINRPFSQYLMHAIANKVDYITLRDEDSMFLLQHLGVDRPPIKVTADPVFALEPSVLDFEEMASLLQEYGIKQHKLVGVSVRYWKALEGHQVELARVLDTLVNNDYQVIFIPMDYAHDLTESQRVADLMEKDAIIIDRCLSSLEHIALISNFDLLVGMRLHSLIFAANRGIPFAGISYDPKIDAFLKSFDLQPLPSDGQAMMMQIENLLQNHLFREKIAARASEMRGRAEENAHLALSLIP